MYANIYTTHTRSVIKICIVLANVAFAFFVIFSIPTFDRNARANVSLIKIGGTFK